MMPRSGISHYDLRRLSGAFNEVADLGVAQDYRINEWLKKEIAFTQPGPSEPVGRADEAEAIET